MTEPQVFDLQFEIGGSLNDYTYPEDIVSIMEEIIDTLRGQARATPDGPIMSESEILLHLASCSGKTAFLYVNRVGDIPNPKGAREGYPQGGDIGFPIYEAVTGAGFALRQRTFENGSGRLVYTHAFGGHEHGNPALTWEGPMADPFVHYGTIRALLTRPDPITPEDWLMGWLRKAEILRGDLPPLQSGFMRDLVPEHAPSACPS